MDWSNERWVKLYVRDTVAMRLMPWQARCLFWELLRKIDLSGWLELDGHGTAGLAVALGCDAGDAERALAEWLKAGWVDDSDPGGLLVPTHVEAQRATQSNALRQRLKRSRRGDTRDHDRVTARDSACRGRSKSVAPDTPSVAPDTGGVGTDTIRPTATPREEREEREEKRERDAHTLPPAPAPDEWTSAVAALADSIRSRPRLQLVHHAAAELAEDALGQDMGRAAMVDHGALRAAVARASARVETGAVEHRVRQVITWEVANALKARAEQSQRDAEPTVRPIVIPPEQLEAMRARARGET